jgi:emp24/gp25L/p24 family/GOLD
MKRIVALLAALVSALCETVVVSGHSSMDIILELTKGSKARVKFYFDEVTGGEGEMALHSAHGSLIEEFKETSMNAFQFLPQLTGEYPMRVKNLSSHPIRFVFEILETSAGPLAAEHADVEPSEELEYLLRAIITSQQSLLARLKKHIGMSMSTKSWIKKMSVVEVLYCVFVLYYVRNDAKNTFYRKRKV